MEKTEQQLFEEAARPLIEYLKSNQHPHVTVIVNSEHAELLEGKLTYDKLNG
jgi:hypothetical protein